MGVEIMKDNERGYQCLYCNSTMWAFGGIFYEDEDVEDFIKSLPNDPRTYSDSEMEHLIDKWRNPGKY